MLDNDRCTKRACKSRAEQSIHAQCKKYSPRGNPKAAAEVRFSKASGSPRSTLYRIFQDDKPTFSAGMQCINSYMQRNTSMEIQKAFAISVMGTAMTEWGYNITEAAQLAADVVGYSAQVIRGWAYSHFTSFSQMIRITPENVTDEDIEAQLSSGRGVPSPHPQSLLFDEEFQLNAQSFIRSNACKKGEPNLTVVVFADWIHTTYGQNVCNETARSWLHNLGFSQLHHQKGVYFDGHDREDVVEYRNEFLTKLAELDKKIITCDGPALTLPEGDRPIIRVMQEESTYYSNCDQSFFWGDDQTNVLKQKSLESSIMVSDFVDE